MLVISRKCGEQIVIGENIELTIVAVRGRRVRIGLSGPPEVQFARREVRERMQDYSRTAAKQPSAMLSKATGS